MSAKVKTITISRKRWGRGTDGGYLRSDDGKQCCLGFVCRAFGFKASEIDDETMPEELLHRGERSKKRAEKLTAWLLEQRGDVSRAAAINDRVDMPDARREKAIKTIFARHGLKAVFTA